MQADLWTFAVTLYARPGVADDCLALQDQGADVCLLLCGAWLEQRGVKHSSDAAAQLREIAEHWSGTVVGQLRELRRGWRDEAQADADLMRLREAVKGLELQAERVLLERLQGCSAGWPTGAQRTSWLEALAPVNLDAGGALPRLRAAASTT
jgi:uncharacterized protein (TIGR02444 family)